MATYYVRQDGNDSNTGLGSTTGLAWRTIQKALGATGIGSGDTVYIAPGHYNETVTISGTYSAETQIIGDPTASQFSGISAGFVKHSQYPSTNNVTNNLTRLMVGTSKNFLHFKNIYFECASQTSVTVWANTGQNIKLTSCVFVNNQRNVATQIDIEITASSGQNLNLQIENCIFYGFRYISLNGSLVSGDTTSVRNSCFLNSYNEGIGFYSTTASIYNCLIYNGTVGVRNSSGSVTTMRNCIISNFTTGINNQATLNADNSRLLGNVTTVSNSGTYTAGSNVITSGTMGLEFGYSLLHNLVNQVIFGSIFGGPNTSFGTATGAPTTDLFGVAWSGTSPDAGAITNRNIGLVTNYLPTERNASTITIAPGSTSQSIELYLGATGLTASTSGLSARYNRTRTVDQPITLVARTIADPWVSGGFAEVNASTMPGVYRLDIPNEALAVGADDVTVVVRGASGTNGAVMSIKLSSGGLTSAQTASAVLDAVGSSYATAGSIGHAIQNNNVTSIVGSTAAASELSGALLHNGTDYIDSNLLGGESTRVFVGRFQMTQTGTTQGDIIEAFTTDTPAFELQLFDGDNNLVPVTGATLGLRILDVTSTVVETGTPTIEYGTGGIVRWTAPGTYLSIGCPAGMYRMFVDRTVSGTTTTFGPLQIKVQVQ